jgi:hypothetical protein
LCNEEPACAQCIELEFVYYSMLDTINLITMTFIGTNITIVHITITKVKVALMHVVLKIARKSTIKVFTSQLTSMMWGFFLFGT